MYTHTARLLHWAVAGMIVVQFVLAELAESAGERQAQLAQLALLANHKSVGITILVLALVRLGWRLAHPPPPLPAQMPGWQVTASHLSHWSLYGLLFALPVSGWLMSSATAYSVSWFNLFTLPDLVAADPQLEDLLKEVHEVLATLLFIVALVHIGAGLKHALIDKDDVLKRMSSTLSIVLFATVAAAGIFVLRPAGGSADSATPAAPAGAASQPAATGSATVEPSTLPRWTIDYAGSDIRFTAEQAGATFEGVWLDWQAEVQFHPDALADSRAVVTVATGRVNTNDSERDATITGSDFFAADQFPQAMFRTTSFRRTEEGFIAAAQLQVKDATVPVELAFQLDIDDAGNGVLTGTSRLDRLLLGVGTGDWTDTSWVGQFVQVNVTVVFTTPSTD